MKNPHHRSTAMHLTRPLLLALLIAVALAGGRAPAAAQSGGVAIVVHPDAPVRNMSMDELRRVFQAEVQFWRDGSRITLLVRAPVAYERDVVLNRIYRMDEEQFRQYWVSKMFRAEVPAGPQVVYSAQMARELVSVIPGAITFMPASEVSSNSRVVRIDGKLPGEAGYPLQ
jgi:ABC-type phosphate transport system substrate-binding protein